MSKEHVLISVMFLLLALKFWWAKMIKNSKKVWCFGKMKLILHWEFLKVNLLYHRCFEKNILHCFCRFICCTENLSAGKGRKRLYLKTSNKFIFIYLHTIWEILSSTSVSIGKFSFAEENCSCYLQFCLWSRKLNELQMSKSAFRNNVSTGSNLCLCVPTVLYRKSFAECHHMITYLVLFIGLGTYRSEKKIGAFGNEC